MEITTGTTRTILIGAAALLTSCSPVVSAAPFGSFPPRADGEDVLLFSVKTPECPYEEVGIVSARKPSRWVSMEEVVDGLKRRAREMGGDAVIGLRETEVDSGGIVSSGVIFATSEPVLRGTVVRFTEDGCRR